MTAENAALYQTIAAFVQAIVMVLAVAVAIWVPTRIASNDRRIRQEEKNLVERGLVVLLYPLVKQVGAEISWVTSRIQSEEEPDFTYSGSVSFRIGRSEEIREFLQTKTGFSPQIGNKLFNFLVAIESHNEVVIKIDRDNWSEVVRNGRISVRKCADAFADLSTALQKLAELN